ncbi:Glycosyl transferase family 2 [Cladophialophora carrionii]|uniref:Glycosyl transferase family 2 n=1 Tax=Cladophialophora carrionii TaxID=86049 RepID=A0A1C1CDA0_9EURO|nr:Glycosyl transferase family 2 [Cladophialophora carrionii]
MEMDEISRMPQRPPMAYHNDDFDFEGPHFPTRSPSQMSFASHADSMAPLGSAGAFKCDIMVKFLRQRQMEKLWSNSVDGEGVILKRGKNDFVCQPSELLFENNGLFHQVCQLNVKVAMTVKTDVIETFLRTSQLPYVPYVDGLRIQVLPDISFLSTGKKHHFAAFIQNPGYLVVWHDDPEQVISRAEKIEQHLVSLLWKDENLVIPKSENASAAPSIREKADNADVEDARRFDDSPRRTILYQAVLMGLAGLLVILTIGVGWRKVAIEVKTDSTYVRLALAAVILPQIWLGWFFFQTLVNGISQLFGPVNQLDANSRTFSGIRSKRLETDTLPHVTVQCPVYKEGLWSVIDPTMVSIREAISTYEMQGGTVNIFVNDDGMQLIKEHEAKERREYYEEHNIGWVARPKHNPNPKPDSGERAFTRAGKFKKASNMNYAMNVSARVEDRLAAIPRHDAWTQQDEDEVYQRILQQIIEEDEGRTWAQGDVRIGDYILIIDSDTRVPADCFLDMVSEMEASPQVAIIQFSSGVMNVTTSFFEKGITFFTNLVYTAIQFAVANGDIAPFVGHNAVLRWSALQDIAYEEDGVEKYWAETTVSEDFDMALRLQSKGYDLRFSTYFGSEGFQEGVSLTVYDELARWEKYAYGCSELIFNPLIYWPTRGPVTPLFRKFMSVIHR